jgi:hypothetical protein
MSNSKSFRDPKTGTTYTIKSIYDVKVSNPVTGIQKKTLEQIRNGK